MLIIDNFIKDENALIKDKNEFFKNTYDYGGESIKDELATIFSWDWKRPPENVQ